MQPYRKRLVVIGVFVSLIITVGVFVGAYLVRREQLRRSEASSGAACNKSSDCEIIPTPGDKGSKTVDREISYIDITDKDVHRFNPGETDDGCRKVSISHKTVSWNRYRAGSDCKQISNIQIWMTGQQTPPLFTFSPTPSPTATPYVAPSPTVNPSPTPSKSPSPTPKPTNSPSPSPTPPGIGGVSPTPTPTATPRPSTTPTVTPAGTSTPIPSSSPTSSPSGIGGISSPSPTDVAGQLASNRKPSGDPQATIPNAGTTSITYIALSLGVIFLFVSIALII